jgi:hypothetical protein
MSEYVNHEALRSMSTNELAGLVNEDGPTALIDAAEAELERRRVNGDDRAYEIASADVVVPLSSDDAHAIAGILSRYSLEHPTLSSDEVDEAQRLAALVSSVIESEQS